MSLRLALQGDDPTPRLIAGNRCHPGAFGRCQLQQVHPAAGGHDQVGFQPGSDRLDQHVDAQVTAIAAERVAYDPAHGTPAATVTSSSLGWSEMTVTCFGAA